MMAAIMTAQSQVCQVEQVGNFVQVGIAAQAVDDALREGEVERRVGNNIGAVRIAVRRLIGCERSRRR